MTVKLLYISDITPVCGTVSHHTEDGITTTNNSSSNYNITVPKLVHHGALWLFICTLEMSLLTYLHYIENSKNRTNRWHNPRTQRPDVNALLSRTL